MSAAENGILEQLLRGADAAVAPIIFAAMGLPERVVLVDPSTQWTVVLQGDAGLFSALLSGAGAGGSPPASKASIEGLKAVDLGKGEDEEEECVICLDGFKNGCEVVKEMPCKHRFHGGCIEKWLGLHGSCPVCRHEMPAEEGERKKEVEAEGERRRRGGGVWVTIAVGRRDEREEEGGRGGDGDGGERTEI